MAKYLEVSVSGYYAWKSRKPSRHALMDAELVKKIKAIQKQHHRRYGSPRIHEELRDTGYGVSRKRVARLIRENDLGSLPKKKYVVTTDSNHGEPVAENLLDRQFDVPLPGLVWVSDITYCPTTEGWLYLCVVIDLCTRHVVGWSTRDDMTSRIVVDAFVMAVIRYGYKPGLLFHSDRGVQYCSTALRSLLAERKGIVQSMSRKGNCWDNACAESFFKTLKRELETLNGTFPREKVRHDLFEYIEVYYNRIRRHSHNAMKPPVSQATRVA
jgi:transposase InsO family protein